MMIDYSSYIEMLKVENAGLREQVRVLQVVLEQIENVDIGRLATLDLHGCCSRCVRIQTLVSVTLGPVGKEE